ncbi:hypothetical protein TELCIR_23531 [Teladorsagia circumcincta]|uniref:Uncharacterized protein n=1 Tax=Teladorsagia circumcincta TaxID=45464 RepID=A0A2G9TAT5_TELCI|nr:hypothetical protein TELCIR_23531 [Teladorsagia circumcincta]
MNIFQYLDYMMSGVEDIAGQQGHYSLRDNFERFNAKILRPILMRNEKKKNFDASSIVRAYQKITLEDAMNLTKLQKAENKRISALREYAARFSLNSLTRKGQRTDTHWLQARATIR